MRRAANAAVYCVGWNEDGQCGQRRASRVVTRPKKVKGVMFCVKAAAGARHTLALTRSKHYVFVVFAAIALTDVLHQLERCTHGDRLWLVRWDARLASPGENVVVFSA